MIILPNINVGVLFEYETIFLEIIIEIYQKTNIDFQKCNIHQGKTLKIKY